MATLKVLMVAEKPILADSIAKILSNGTSSSRKGSNGVCSVAEYSGKFQGQKAYFKFTSTCGHVMSVDFPQKYNSWDRVDPSELFLAPIDKNEANPKMRMVSYLAGEAKGVDVLVLWLDCDKEGENICFEVISACSKAMNKRSGNIMDSVYRARFSAVSKEEIFNAMNNLVKPNLNESLSVDARQELDLRIGCAFTRFQTRYFQNKYGDLDATLISFGPCQTPTLAFCVQRHDLITQFKPEVYWVLKVEVDGGGRTLKLDWARERIFDKDIAQIFLNRIKAIDRLVVDDLSSKEGRKERPAALNTVELLRVASASLGIGPQTTMSTAEHLYTRGFISYPRTETTAYPKGFNFKQVLSQQTNSKYSNIVKQLLDQPSLNPKGGKDAGDHPPIVPQKPADGQLSGDGARIYEYVLQHFLATIMGPCKYVTQTLKLSAGEEKFSIASKRVVDPGFTEVLTWQAVVENEASLEQFAKGSKLAIRNVELVEKQTSPPGYLTESELISLMEKYGIGTDASISVHITNISQRNYVEVGSNRTLLPTKLGISLIRGYQHVDPELIQPNMRAEVETQLNLIAKGQANFDTVKNHVLNMFRLKFVYFVENISSVDSLFEASFTSLAESGKPFSRCGKCLRFMKLVETRPQRLYCPNCQDTYSLPTGKDAQIRLHAEKKCPLDGFDLLYLHTAGGKLASNYAFCPYCFNNPPFDGMRKGSGCNNCFHPTCPNSSITQGVAMCLNACSNETGVLVLDPQSGSKWKLSCNRCPSVVSLFDGAWKLNVLDKRCHDCGALKISCEYKEGKSKLPNGELTYNGCVFCDRSDNKLNDELLNLNHAHLNKDVKIGGGRPSRGGRGRGRGGSRGRGASSRGTTSRGRGKR